jgi:ABC-type molybdenum transport system ATPase subunit/photorepair protein PhrA
MERVTLRMGDRMLLPGTSWEIRKFLIARALLHSPKLLILDDPCQGLDRSNRERVVALMEGIGKRTETDLIYVTHHEEELIPVSIMS